MTDAADKPPIDGQTSITDDAVGDGGPTASYGPCEWCGAPGTIKRPFTRKVKGKPGARTPTGTFVVVCDQHERQARELTAVARPSL